MAWMVWVWDGMVLEWHVTLVASGERDASDASDALDASDASDERGIECFRCFNASDEPRASDGLVSDNHIFVL